MNNYFVIDAGNTEIVVAFIKNNKIFQLIRIKTIDFKKNNNIFFKKFKIINKFLKLQKNIKCIISSVVPEINSLFKKLCLRFLNEKPHFVTYNKTKLSIKIDIKNKKQLGADRIVNTVATKTFYKLPALVIDFGTTTTFDIINHKGNYIGGLISPGINMSLDNLYKKTSKLPLVKFKKNKQFIGKNTKNAIESGVYWGYVGLISFLIDKIQSKFKKKLFCISTGGLSKIISKDITKINKINDKLTILGLIEIFKLNYNE